MKPSNEQLSIIGQKIFQNETGGKVKDLVYWNTLEAFPSLGLGHFIWMPEGYSDPNFGDGSFPELIAFYKASGYRDQDLPKLLQGNRSRAPWKTRTEMYALYDANDADILELQQFLYTTFDVQIDFIWNRLQAALPNMLAKASNPSHLQTQFNRLATSPLGYYPLIDYVNFKGEGLSGNDYVTYMVDILGTKGEDLSPKRTRAYNNYGWGLRQVLMEMKGSEKGVPALEEFSRSAGFVLTKRVENAALEGRDESSFLQGWLNRTKTYAISLF
ncbi:hypothetical protein PVA45_04595 [Entomospira entomophila]|uniref:hypothetical protein n=1 Tax=Entomospira entomophila TaxID=2719988 RepID=UPI001BAFD58F|nr:hypothetical protein [Entomospira entomophilus]WDI34997.1 hypothetical protein PVA45_04595 [Entomospira entomophilus]